MKKALATIVLCISSFAAGVAQQNVPDMSAITAAMGALAEKSPQKPAVDFRKLKAWLPAELNGMKRTSASGEKTGMGAFTVSVATGEYTKDDDTYATLTVTDMGGMGALGAMAQWGMLASEIDREDDGGYERSFALNGNKGIESYRTAEKTGEIKLFVGERFMVELNVTNIDAPTLKKIATQLDLASLANIKGEE